MTTKIRSNSDGSSDILNGALVAAHIATGGKVSFPQQPQVVGGQGSIELPGGIIKKWGYFANTNDIGIGYSRVTFPTPFPNGCDNVQVTSLTGAPGYPALIACPVSGSFAPTHFDVIQYDNSGTPLANPGAGAIYWEATGH